MPIFMDRHYVEGANWHELEVAHQQDLALQDQYGVKFLTYWFDEHRHAAFCLVEAPSADLVTQVHADAHGFIPNQVIPVQRETVEAFLGGIEGDDGQSDDGTSGFRTIMFTDLVGFTAITARLGDRRAMELLRIHNGLIREALRLHDGREVKHTGDGIMASFRDASKALACGNAIQAAFDRHNKDNPDVPMEVRIGLAAGEPVEENGDLFGSAVQLASRLCDIAQARQTLLTSEVYACLHGADEIGRLVDQGMHGIKGFDEPVRVYSVYKQAS